MGLIKDRKIAIKGLKRLIANPSQVFVIHYSQVNTFDDEYNVISPMVSAIVVKSLDGNTERHFAIHIEADKANIPIEDIENSYRELEFRILKSFNEFVKRHRQCLWVHWDMKNIHFGFEGIKHRFEKILMGLNGINERYEEIATNNKINLCYLLESVYGDKFAPGPDSLSSMIKLNNDNVLVNEYLSLQSEADEFDRKNYHSVINSLDCKANYMLKFVKLLSKRELKVYNKNWYAVFIEFITHPLVNFIGLVIGFILGALSLM